VQEGESAEQVFVSFTVKAGKRAEYSDPLFHGEIKLTNDSILNATGWRVPLILWWRQGTHSRTRAAGQGIRGRKQKGHRFTTQVELEKLDYDAEHRRVKPTVGINAGPKINVKSVEAKVSQRVIKRYVPIFQERAVDNDLLVEGARNLR